MNTLYKIIAFFIMIAVTISGYITHTTDENTTYYFDAVNGRDTNIGICESKPLKSLDLMKRLKLKSGDTVLLKTDGVFRGRLVCQKGVTYGSYGEGEMPVIMPSTDASGERKWKKTDYENVWKFRKKIDKDAGNIIFDGEKTGIKIAAKINGYEGKVDELKNDLEFYHGDDEYVYLYSVENPAKRFKSIEIATRIYGIELTDGVTIDSLKVLYAGSHGIGASDADNITVKNCEVGFCGGSLQYEGVRFGNGVQFWSSGNNITVENCHVYEIYDAGLTFQASEGGIFKNITFKNNLVEKCTYSIEYFTHGDGYFENILIDNNYLKNAGYGWGVQRPDPVHTSHINSWYSHDNKAYNFVISNNILQCCPYALFNVGSLAGTPPTFIGNTYRQPHSGYMFSNHSNFYTEKAFDLMAEMDPTGKMENYYGPIE